ncbi:MAG: helix-hairpin-helix domain-containing protein [Candidatus Sericytochromatia bacterium]
MIKKIINTIIISSIFCLYSSPVIAASNTFISTMITVQVAGGGVIKPGIYKLPSGSRLVDVISKAGGLKKDAFLQDINMTVPIKDGSSIYIASKSEVIETKEEKKEDIKKEEKEIKPVSKIDNSKNYKHKDSKVHKKSITKKTKHDGLVNLNIATEEELNNLPGIGDTLAKNIISYRTKNGKFKSIEDLNKVEGIGDKKFKKLKNKVTI